MRGASPRSPADRRRVTPSRPDMARGLTPRHEAREHDLRQFAVPTDEVERFERFVREVEDVADADVTVVRRGREEHVRELPVVGAGANRGDDAALRAFRVAY